MDSASSCREEDDTKTIVVVSYHALHGDTKPMVFVSSPAGHDDTETLPQLFMICKHNENNNATSLP
jgi:hypothetical protein